MTLTSPEDKIFESRVKSVKVAVVFGFLIGFLFSPRLWTNSLRYFPVIEPVAGIPKIPFPIDILITVLFVALLVTWLFVKRNGIGLASMGILVLILLQDQMRWQPWVYVYLIMLLPFLFQSDSNAKQVLNCQRWIIAGIYFWSGVHKLNPNFLQDTFTQMLALSGLGKAFSAWKETGYLIAAFEISVGLALLSKRFRRVGVYLAVTMHAFILLYLSPFVLNHNSVVYPWNVIMVVFVFLLFWNLEDNIFYSITEFKEIRFALLRTALIILVWVIPVLNFSGHWDHYLSFSLYSDKPSRFYIAIEESELQKIDQRLGNYFVEIPGLKGGQIIDVDKWAFSELNVPFYPEMRAFQSLSQKFCELRMGEANLIFLEKTRLHGEEHFVKFSCRELAQK